MFFRRRLFGLKLSVTTEVSSNISGEIALWISAKVSDSSEVNDWFMSVTSNVEW